MAYHADRSNIPFPFPGAPPTAWAAISPPLHAPVAFHAETELNTLVNPNLEPLFATEPPQIPHIFPPTPQSIDYPVGSTNPPSESSRNGRGAVMDVSLQVYLLQKTRDSKGGFAEVLPNARIRVSVHKGSKIMRLILVEPKLPPEMLPNWDLLRVFPIRRPLGVTGALDPLDWDLLDGATTTKQAFSVETAQKVDYTPSDAHEPIAAVQVGIRYRLLATDVAFRAEVPIVLLESGITVCTAVGISPIFTSHNSGTSGATRRQRAAEAESSARQSPSPPRNNKIRTSSSPPPPHHHNNHHDDAAGLNDGTLSPMSSSNSPVAAQSSPHESSSFESEPTWAVISSNLHVDGVVRAHAYAQMSDERLKTEIEDISQALDTLVKLRGTRFCWRKGEPTSKWSISDNSSGLAPQDVIDCPGSTRKVVGFIAQEVQRVYPDMVYETEQGYLSVDYLQVVGLLVESFKSLVRQQNALSATVASSNRQAMAALADIQARITAMEVQLSKRRRDQIESVSTFSPPPLPETGSACGITCYGGASGFSPEKSPQMSVAFSWPFLLAITFVVVGLLSTAMILGVMLTRQVISIAPSTMDFDWLSANMANNSGFEVPDKYNSSKAAKWLGIYERVSREAAEAAGRETLFTQARFDVGHNVVRLDAGDSVSQTVQIKRAMLEQVVPAVQALMYVNASVWMNLAFADQQTVTWYNSPAMEVQYINSKNGEVLFQGMTQPTRTVAPSTSFPLSGWRQLRLMGPALGDHPSADIVVVNLLAGNLSNVYFDLADVTFVYHPRRNLTFITDAIRVSKKDVFLEGAEAKDYNWTRPLNMTSVDFISSPEAVYSKFQPSMADRGVYGPILKITESGRPEKVGWTNNYLLGAAPGLLYLSGLEEGFLAYNATIGMNQKVMDGYGFQSHVTGFDDVGHGVFWTSSGAINLNWSPDPLNLSKNMLKLTSFETNTMISSYSMSNYDIAIESTYYNYTTWGACSVFVIPRPTGNSTNSTILQPRLIVRRLQTACAKVHITETALYYVINPRYSGSRSQIWAISFDQHYFVGDFTWPTVLHGINMAVRPLSPDVLMVVTSAHVGVLSLKPQLNCGAVVSRFADRGIVWRDQLVMWDAGSLKMSRFSVSTNPMSLGANYCV